MEKTCADCAYCVIPYERLLKDARMDRCNIGFCTHGGDFVVLTDQVFYACDEDTFMPRD